jgi:hypothetical protein
MGQLIYGSTPTVVDIDDRALAHLKVVIIAKLRRSEGFVFSWDDEVSTRAGLGRSSVWLHPGIAIQFRFFGSRQPALNKQWLDDLMIAANSGGGLRVSPESTARGETNEVPNVY